MLITGEMTLWRRLKFDELAVFCDGDGITVEICNQSQTEISVHRIGCECDEGKKFHVLIPAGVWARFRHAGTNCGIVNFLKAK
jgi:predicted cupin superfamily sugar epimerase